MTDHLSRRARSDLMRRIPSRGTKPEKLVMKLVRVLVGSFRAHATSLPGQPDIAVFGLRRAVFVHGCFWHQHAGCSRSNVPRSNRTYWIPKLARNVARDKQNLRALRSRGWKAAVIWECDCKNPDRLEKKLRRFLTTSKNGKRAS